MDEEKLLEELNLFPENTETLVYDLYFISYAGGPMSKDTRKQLKELGWRLQKHSRTNQEIWVFDK